MRTKFYAIAMSVFFVVFIPLMTYGKSQLEARKELGQLNIQCSPEAFVESAANGDVLAVTLFLEAGMDVNAKHGDTGMTALIAAASKGCTEVVKILLERNADMNVKDKRRYTALMQTVKGNFPEVAEILLDAGAEVEEKYQYESSALSLAAMFPYRNLIGTALYIANSIQDPLDTPEALRDIATTLANVGNFDQALEVAQSMKNTWTQAPTLRDIAASLAKTGNIDQALEVARSIEDPDAKAVALANIAEALAKADNTQKAEEVFTQALELAQPIEAPGKKVWVLLDIAKALARAGNTKKAEEVFSQVFKEVQSMPIFDEELKISVLQNLAKALAEVGNVKQAFDVAQPIKYADPKTWALTAIAEASAERGDSQESEKAFKQALDVAQTIEDEFLQVKVLRDIVEALARVDNIDQAFDVTSLIDSQYTGVKAVALANIAKALAKAGNPQKAEEVFAQALVLSQTIKDLDYKPRILHPIIKALGEIGRLDKALDVAQTLDEYSKRKAFLNISLQALSLEESQQTEFASKIMTAFAGPAPSEKTPTEMWVMFDTTETGILTPWAPEKVSGVDEWTTSLSVKNNLDLWLELVPGIEEKGVMLNHVDCLASQWQREAFGKAGHRLLPPKGEVKYDVTYQKAGVPFYAKARFGKYSAGLMIIKFLASLPVPGIDQLDNPVTFLEFWEEVRDIKAIAEASLTLQAGKMANAAVMLSSLLDDEQQIEMLHKAFAKFKLDVSKEVLDNFLTVGNIIDAWHALEDEIILAIQSQAGAKPIQVSFVLKSGREPQPTPQKAANIPIKEETSIPTPQKIRTEDKELMAQYYPLQEGRTWTYERIQQTGYAAFFKDTKTYSLKAMKPRTVNGQQVVPLQYDDGNIYYIIEDNAGVGWYGEQKIDDIESRIYKQINYHLKYPLKTGTTWQWQTSTYLLMENRIIIDETVIVEALEDIVTVPAGTFEHCIRVKYAGTRKVKVGYLGDATVKDVSYEWFAPDVGFVKAITTQSSDHSMVGTLGKQIIQLLNFTK